MSAATSPLSRPAAPKHTWRTVGIAIGLAVFVACLVFVEARWSRLPEAPGIVVDYLGLMSRGVFADPLADPNSEYWTRAVALMIESIHMAWIGTLIGAAFSLPLAFLAAENVSPKPVVFVARNILNAIRAVPELVLAIIVMLPIFGLGPVAGTMALGIHSIGTLGKLTSEVIEGADPGPVEAAVASGARPFQILRSATVPQVMPEIVAFWLYRFEINIRAGAVLGVLGAGGIGSLLSSVLSRRLWERAGITLVVVILVTIVVDLVSERLRRRIIRGRQDDFAEELAPMAEGFAGA
jgi:phosphonate transport system permease protein